MIDGLLISGIVVPVPGVTFIDAGIACAGEGRARTNRPHQVIIHRTIGDDPDTVIPGAGPANGAIGTADYFASPEGLSKHAGAHIVIGSAGEVACLADLVFWESWHATISNPYSIGIEMHEQARGVLYSAQLEAACAIVGAICEHVGIQLQIPRAPYSGKPLRRMASNGGTDVIGVLGHRDNTTDRGRWDPGDVIFGLLKQRGAEAYDFDAGDDLFTWKQRQGYLVANGHVLTIDGIPGPATTAALLAEGYRGGVYALGKLGGA